MVPWIELDPTSDHAVVAEQIHGITMHRVAEINAMSAQDQANDAGTAVAGTFGVSS